MQHKLIKGDVWCEKWIEHRGVDNKQAKRGRLLTGDMIHSSPGFSKLHTRRFVFAAVAALAMMTMMKRMTTRWTTI